MAILGAGQFPAQGPWVPRERLVLARRSGCSPTGGNKHPKAENPARFFQRLFFKLQTPTSGKVGLSFPARTVRAGWCWPQGCQQPYEGQAAPQQGRPGGCPGGTAPPLGRGTDLLLPPSHSTLASRQPKSPVSKGKSSKSILPWERSRYWPLQMLHVCVLRAQVCVMSEVVMLEIDEIMHKVGACRKEIVMFTNI